MKKLLPITILALTLVATPAFAVSDKANVNAHKNKNLQQEIQTVTVEPTVSEEITPTVTVTLTPTITPQKEKKVLGESTNKKSEASSLDNEECSPSATYKNHGEYVSCVAHQKLGGQAVSAAARSDIGKKKAEVTPTASPTATPTITPPLTSPVLASESNFDPLASLGSLIDRFVGFMNQLI